MKEFIYTSQGNIHLYRHAMSILKKAIVWGVLYSPHISELAHTHPILLKKRTLYIRDFKLDRLNVTISYKDPYSSQLLLYSCDISPTNDPTLNIF